MDYFRRDIKSTYRFNCKLCGFETNNIMKARIHEAQENERLKSQISINKQEEKDDDT